jgi:hypothetical protein
VSEAPRLIGGPYRPPRPRKGRLLYDLLRGDVAVVGTSAAPVPWPVARTRPGSRPMPVVDAELVRAIRTESVAAVIHHWGVSRSVATRWRHRLGVPRFNAGTRVLWSQLAASKFDDAGRRKGHQRQREAIARRRATPPAASTAGVSEDR